MKASGFLDSLVIEFKQRPSGLRHFLLSGLSIPYATAFPADSATIKSQPTCGEIRHAHVFHALPPREAAREAHTAR